MLKTWTVPHAQADKEYRYDPATGVLLGRSGRPTGHIKRKGGFGSRVKVVVARKGESCLPIARLIWFLVTGEWPSFIVDHINGDPFDQRWVNLRLATVAENNFNSAQPLGVSGYRNVVRGKRGHGWLVQFDRKARGKRTKWFTSRQFATPEDAGAEAERMRAEIHGAYASTRTR